MAEINKSFEEDSTKYLAEISNGTSVFKYIPNDIGVLCFCGSDNYKACADDSKTQLKQSFLAIIIFTIIPLISLLIFSESPIWNTVLSLGCVAILVWTLHNIYSFTGVDYFVGTEGFCHLKFTKTRDNISELTTIHFLNVSDLLTEQIHIKSNGSYRETQYYISFVSEQEKKVLYWERGKYNKSSPDIVRYFYDNVIDSWNNYKLKDLGVIPMNFNAFSISKGVIESAAIPYIVIEPDYLSVHEQKYYYTDIKLIKLERIGDDICLMIEHKNHEIVKKSFWRKQETGDVEHIPLAALGNHDFFFKYLSWLISTKDLPFEPNNT